jgi:hypothetical protein
VKSDKNSQTKTRVSKLAKIHLRKQMKDAIEDQKVWAVYLCNVLMEDTALRVYDTQDHAPDIVEILNFYRLRIMNQIRFILEASDVVESEFRKKTIEPPEVEG